jgi:hypothetical protein
MVGCFRGKVPHCVDRVDARGTESSEVVARLSGTESSNTLPSSGEVDDTQKYVQIPDRKELDLGKPLAL